MLTRLAIPTEPGKALMSVGDFHVRTVPLVLQAEPKSASRSLGRGFVQPFFRLDATPLRLDRLGCPATAGWLEFGQATGVGNAQSGGRVMSEDERRQDVGSASANSSSDSCHTLQPK